MKVSVYIRYLRDSSGLISIVKIDATGHVFFQSAGMGKLSMVDVRDLINYEDIKGYAIVSGEEHSLAPFGHDTA
jgi:hypothetical protein